MRLKIDLVVGRCDVSREDKAVQGVHRDLQERIDAEEGIPHQGSKDLCELLVAACLSTIWGEYARAEDLWMQALALVGEEASDTLRAEILEGSDQVRRSREACEWELPVLLAKVQQEPENSESHFHLALILSGLGDGESFGGVRSCAAPSGRIVQGLFSGFVE